MLKTEPEGNTHFYFSVIEALIIFQQELLCHHIKSYTWYCVIIIQFYKPETLNVYLPRNYIFPFDKYSILFVNGKKLFLPLKIAIVKALDEIIK